MCIDHDILNILRNIWKGTNSPMVNIDLAAATPGPYLPEW